jgi:hypothetical protein
MRRMTALENKYYVDAMGDLAAFMSVDGLEFVHGTG